MSVHPGLDHFDGLVVQAIDFITSHFVRSHINMEHIM